MFERFRNFFRRKPKMKWDLSNINTTMSMGGSSGISFIDTNPSQFAMTVYSDNNETIMTIDGNGQLKWHKEDKVDEAVAIFAEAFTIQIENKAEIKQNRKEWELRITKVLARRAEKEPLTPEVLTDTIRKCIMLDTLKGIK